MISCIFQCLRHIIIYILIATFLLPVVNSTVMQMRVVKDTAMYGYAGGSLLDADSTNKLVAAVQPSNFSGPVLLKKLVGKCFNMTEERYKYVFCPFQNITQYEVSARWNAYQGILGIWSHWEIENNTFSHMVFKNGDQCGDIERSVKISLMCGSKNELLNVTEPNRCQYSTSFTTPFACHKDALLVYPRLDVRLRNEWDRVHTNFIAGDLTKKGYELSLQKIFQAAGFSETPATLEEKKSTTVYSEKRKFTTLLSCNEEYKKLHEELSKLNAELESLKVLIGHQRLNNMTSPLR